jgi:hypothetical protein
MELRESLAHHQREGIWENWRGDYITGRCETVRKYNDDTGF